MVKFLTLKYKKKSHLFLNKQLTQVRFISVAEFNIIINIIYYYKVFYSSKYCYY